jgi:hypothetical protein
MRGAGRGCSYRSMHRVCEQTMNMQQTGAVPIEAHRVVSHVLSHSLPQILIVPISLEISCRTPTYARIGAFPCSGLPRAFSRFFRLDAPQL